MHPPALCWARGKSKNGAIPTGYDSRWLRVPHAGGDTNPPTKTQEATELSPPALSCLRAEACFVLLQRVFENGQPPQHKVRQGEGDANAQHGDDEELGQCAQAAARQRILDERDHGHMLDAGDGALESTLALLPQGAEVSAERLILATEAACRDAACRDVVGRDAVGADGGGRAFALGMAGALLSAGAHAGDLDVDLAGSMAGVLLDDFALARRFWLRRVEAARSKRGEEREPRPAVPQTPAQLCRWWAGELAAAGRVGSDGFAFDPEASSPRAALECLHLALRLEPDDLDTVRRLEALAATLPGRDHLRLAHLSTLALHAPGDWRVGLKLGLAGLKTFRLEAGLADIAKARADADAQGKAEAFARTLAALDSKGLVAAEFAAPCG